MVEINRFTNNLLEMAQLLNLTLCFEIEMKPFIGPNAHLYDGRFLLRLYYISATIKK